MTLADDTAAPIERFGHKWRIPEMRDMGVMQTRIPMVPEKERPFISPSMVMQFCGSFLGCDTFLAHLIGKSELQIQAVAGEIQRMALVADLLKRFGGDAMVESETSRLPCSRRVVSRVGSYSSSAPKDRPPASRKAESS